MRIGDICTRSIVTCRRDTRVAELARIMRDQRVGAVIVVDPKDGESPRPVGVVTDRDLVVRVMAKGVDPETVAAGDLLERALGQANETEPLREAVRRMRDLGVRRLAVVDDQSGLVGVIATDDVIKVLADVLLDVSEVASRQNGHKRRRRN
ncbi:MAG TPA: CBS domain-containing protein [Roseateles sp.]